MVGLYSAVTLRLLGFAVSLRKVGRSSDAPIPDCTTGDGPLRMRVMTCSVRG